MPPVLTQLFSDKLSNSSTRDLYACCGVNFATDTVNSMAPQFLNHWLFAVDALNKGAGVWIPATRIIGSPDINHWITADHAVGQISAVGDAVGKKSDYSEENYKTDFEIWMENYKLQFDRENVERSRLLLESSPVGANISDAKKQHWDIQHINEKCTK